jgi:hypothetical protein
MKQVWVFRIDGYYSSSVARRKVSKGHLDGGLVFPSDYADRRCVELAVAQIDVRAAVARRLVVASQTAQLTR